MILKQSTAFTFRIGPFVDDTDGKTAETGLTIAQADIQISKNGGAFAQTSASPTTTHDTDGWYQCPLTATDTGTLGTLDVQIVISGALPVWRHFVVVPAVVYDSLVAGSDYLTVDAVQIEGVDATNQIRDAVVDDATRIDASALNTLSGHDPGEVIMGATDLGTGAGLTSLATAANLTTLTGYVDTEVAAILAAVDTEVAAIKAKTDNLPASPAAVGSAMTLSAGAITSGSFAAGAIDAAAIAADAIGASELAADAAAEIGTAVWASSTRTLSSFGTLVTDIWAAGTRTLTSVADSAGVTTLLSRIVGTLAAGTHNAQSGDAYARLGAPAGASVSADVAAVKAQTAAIEADTQDLQTQVGVDGVGLTAIGDTRIANLDATVSSRLAAASYTAPLDAAGTRTAIGLVTANLDTQLAGLPTDADVQAAATAALNAYDPPTNAEMEARTLVAASYATAAALDAVDNYVDTEIAAIKAKTDNLPSDPADQSAVEAAIAAATSTLATAANLATLAGYVDTEVAAIKAKTDNLPASPAAVGSAMTLTAAYDAAKTAATQTSVDDLPTNAELAAALAAADDAVLAAIADVPTVAEFEARTLPAADYTVVSDLPSVPSAASIADAVWDEAIAGHAGAGSTGAALAAAGTAGDPWSTALPGAYGAGTAGKLLADLPTAAEVVAAMDADPPAVNVTYQAGVAVAAADASGNVPAYLADRAHGGSAATITAKKVTLINNEAYAKIVEISNSEIGGVGIYVNANQDIVGDLVGAVESLAVGAQQDVRDAMKLAPTAGDPAAGSIDAHLDDILEDTGTTLPGLLSSTVAGSNDVTTAGSITRKRGNSWSIALTLGAITGYTSLWFTAKLNTEDADTAAIIQIKKNASGSGDGLLYVNGAAPTSAALGSITVSDATTGAIIVALDETITDDLTPDAYYYDCQVLISGNVTTPETGTLTVTADVTRSVA